MHRRLLTLLLVGSVTAGCTRPGADAPRDAAAEAALAESTNPPARPDPPAAEALVFQAPVSRAGRIVPTGNGLRFIACGDGAGGVPFEDLPGEEAASLLRELGAGENGMTVMVRLEANRLQEIRYAGPEGADCDRLPPDGEVEARGNEPFWHVRVDGGEARVRTPESPDGVVYLQGAWSRPGPTAWRYDARRGGERLVLELTEARCADGMSGARHPLRAALTRNGRRMEGCALEGREAAATSAGEAPGDWIVTGYTAPGVSALSGAEAATWIGYTIRLGAAQAVAGAEVCANPTYRESVAPADRFLMEAYRIRAVDLGLESSDEPELRVTRVFCGESAWIVPGGVLIRVAEDRGYTVWDGVFFELRPLESN